jgi:hypothetical protein
MTSTVFEVPFNDQVKENEMDGACSTYESDEKILIRMSEWRDHLEEEVCVECK